MSGDRDPRYRLSDVERDEAISALADAYAEGRLDEAEFGQRMGAASSSRFAADLDPLFADLPPRPTRRAVAVRTSRAPGRGGPPMLLVPFAAVAAVLLVGYGWILVPVLLLLLARGLPRPPHGPGRRAHRSCAGPWTRYPGSWRVTGPGAPAGR